MVPREQLDLIGAVAAEDLRSILEGLDPRSGEKIVGWRTVAGFDLTLSAPKSVSLLWALGGEEVAAQVMAAHDVAVEAAVAYFEDEACVVRRGRGGVNHLDGAGFVAAAFRHRTSRESDPNLHTHLVTGNLTLGEDGKWSALHSADLYRHGRTAGFVYQSVLRHEVAGRLAVSFQPTKPGIGEVVGIPEKARRAFSRRRAAIERSMADHGIHSARGAQVATLDSRPAKPLRPGRISRKPMGATGSQQSAAPPTSGSFSGAGSGCVPGRRGHRAGPADARGRDRVADHRAAGVEVRGRWRVASRERGKNWLVPHGDEGRAERPPDKCTIRLGAGDVLRVLTPGGGGWGAPSAGAERRMRQDRRTTVDLVRFERGEPDVARAPRVRTVGTATESPGRAILHGPTRGWGMRFALGRTPA